MTKKSIDNTDGGAASWSACGWSLGTVCWVCALLRVSVCLTFAPCWRLRVSFSPNIPHFDSWNPLKKSVRTSVRYHDVDVNMYRTIYIAYIVPIHSAAQKSIRTQARQNTSNAASTCSHTPTLLLSPDLSRAALSSALTAAPHPQRRSST